MAHLDEERIVEVDRQGRMVLPSRLREKLGLKKGGRVSVKLENSKVVIQPRGSESIEERARSWLQTVLNTKSQLFSEEALKSDSKWMSSDYARKKLGLR